MADTVSKKSSSIVPFFCFASLIVSFFVIVANHEHVTNFIFANSEISSLKYLEVEGWAINAKPKLAGMIKDAMKDRVITYAEYAQIKDERNVELHDAVVNSVNNSLEANARHARLQAEIDSMEDYEAHHNGSLDGWPGILQ
jgi:hypothetical protein